MYVSASSWRIIEAAAPAAETSSRGSTAPLFSDEANVESSEIIFSSESGDYSADQIDYKPALTLTLEILKLYVYIKQYAAFYKVAVLKTLKC